MQRGQPDPEAEKTIVGFLFQGYDFGSLWEKLTDQQREQIKTEVFKDTLQMNGISHESFPNNTYYATAEKKTDTIKKSNTTDKDASSTKVDTAAKTVDATKSEKVLAECECEHRCCGGFGGGFGGFGCSPYGFGCGYYPGLYPYGGFGFGNPYLRSFYC